MAAFACGTRICSAPSMYAASPASLARVIRSRNTPPDEPQMSSTTSCPSLFQPPQNPNLLRAKTAKVSLTQLFDGGFRVRNQNLLSPFDVRCLSRVSSQGDQIPQYAARRTADELDHVLPEQFRSTPLSQDGLQVAIFRRQKANFRQDANFKLGTQRPDLVDPIEMC